ncbi:MAG: hypothetical protein LUF87_05685 [Alistipes sp.]|nr:hypothetical protein [Alistipes sp.]
MIPVKLDKKECVLVSGKFSDEDIVALHENPTLLSAKVSYIKSTITRLFVKGFNTYLLTSGGLFDLMVANVINDLNNKGLAVMSVFIKPFPNKYSPCGDNLYPEDLTHLSFCFCDSEEEFTQSDFSSYLSHHSECVLSPSRVKRSDNYRIPAAIMQVAGSDRPLN